MLAPPATCLGEAARCARATKKGLQSCYPTMPRQQQHSWQLAQCARARIVTRELVLHEPKLAAHPHAKTPAAAPKHLKMPACVWSYESKRDTVHCPGFCRLGSTEPHQQVWSALLLLRIVRASLLLASPIERVPRAKDCLMHVSCSPSPPLLADLHALRSAGSCLISRVPF